MTNNTKQSEETYIRWSVNMNSAIEVGQLQPEPILTIHPDGRVTTSPRLKPDEISALVLDQIKTAWLKDAQATKIRELESEIEEKRKDVVWLATEKAKLENYVTELENRLRAVWDKYDGDRKYYMDRIKRLEEAGDGLMKSINCGCPYGPSVFNCQTCTNSWDAWRKAKEAKP